MFGSGSGTNFQSIQKQIESGELPLTITCVISNKASAGILEFAKQYQIDQMVLAEKDFASYSEFESGFHGLLDDYKPDLLILAGYMRKIPDSIIDRYKNRIVNIHPALLPSFGGQGMYGDKVHQAVFNSGVKVSGATVHFVNHEYDKGPIIMQDCINLKGTESAEEIGKKVLKIEHQLYAKALKYICSGRFQIKDNRVVLNND